MKFWEKIVLLNVTLAFITIFAVTWVQYGQETLTIIANLNVAGEYWSVTGIGFLVAWFLYSFKRLKEKYGYKKSFLLGLMFTLTFWISFDLLTFSAFYLCVKSSNDPSMSVPIQSPMSFVSALRQIFVWRWQQIITFIIGLCGTYYTIWKEDMKIGNAFLIGLAWTACFNFPTNVITGVLNYHWLEEPWRTRYYWLIFIPEYLFCTAMVIGLWKDNAIDKAIKSLGRFQYGSKKTDDDKA